MSCDYRDTVAAGLLGGLPTQEALVVEEHVLRCDECAAHRRDLTIVRTMLDTVDRHAADPPAQLSAAAAVPAAEELSAITRTAQRRSRRDLRLLVAVAVIAAASGLLTAGALGWGTRQPVVGIDELDGTPLAPDASASVRYLQRAEGTILDVEASGLPSGTTSDTTSDPPAGAAPDALSGTAAGAPPHALSGDVAGRYLVVLRRSSEVLASQEFTVDADGWAQVVLATTRPVIRGDRVTVERLDGPTAVTVLR